MPAKRKTKNTKKQKREELSTQAQLLLLAIMSLSLTGMLFAYAVLSINL